MTDGNADWQTSPAEQADRPRRAALVAGAAVATLVLATVGAIGGWALAGDGSTDLAAGAGSGATSTTEPVPTKTSKSRPATLVPPDEKTSTAPAPPDGQFELPDLTGQSFQQVRSELRDRGLGWRLVFGQAGEDPTVVRTDPVAGTAVHKGIAVKVYVAGAAPLTSVPVVTGLSCTQAQARLVDAGLEPDYPTGRSGPVLRQDPEPGAQIRWNEKVLIYCGNAPPTDSPGQPTPVAS
jgi:beta-lactam-binding protein with PASTA domain